MMNLRFTIYDLRLAFENERCFEVFATRQSSIVNRQLVTSLFSLSVSK